MRKSMAVAGAVVAVLALAACGAGSAAPAVTVTKEVTQAAPAPAPAPVPQSNPAQEYVDFLRSKDPAFYAVDEATSIDTGNTICEAIGQGMSVESIATVGAASGLTSDQVAAVVAGAVIFLCPEYQAQVEAELQGY